MKTRLLYLAAVLTCAASAARAGVSVNESIRHEMSIAPLGSFWINNPFGTIDISGSDIERIVVTGTKTIFAADRDALDEAREGCNVTFEGDENVRLVRTNLRAIPKARCVISYTVQLPRGTDVKISSKEGDIRVRNVNGSVTLKGFQNRVFFAGVTGASTIDIVNGYIQLEYARAPVANVDASTVNGDINVYVPPGSNFEWLGNTLVGDLMTTMGVRGSLTGPTFQGHFNAPGGPLLKTQSVAGHVRMLAVGTTATQARSVLAADLVSMPNSRSGMSTPKLQSPVVAGNFVADVPDRIMDVSIGEVQGTAKVAVAAGSIELRSVLGDCDVATGGGPLILGEVSGKVQARTGGGDVLVRAARVGGDVRTDGGGVLVLYTGGPMTLQSGGGDIVVRQAAGAINAQTPSGDITMTVDPTIKSQKTEAKTGKGNIVLNVPPGFGADIDATVITSDPDTNAIRSDFPSLSIRREQAGNRTRIHMTGKINGGGERVELHADTGDITINSQTQVPVSVVGPGR